MNKLVSRTGPALAAIAALAMTASPAMARDWYGKRWHRGHDRIDTGDVLAGVLVIGGIAAIASAASSASRAKRDDPYHYPQTRDDVRRDDDRSYGEPRDDRGYAPGGRSGEALNGAVDACVGEVERGERRVDTVDTVSRTMGGYRVEGRIGSGPGFTCTVDGGGQIRSISVDGQAI